MNNPDVVRLGISYQHPLKCGTLQSSTVDTSITTYYLKDSLQRIEWLVLMGRYNCKERIFSSKINDMNHEKIEEFLGG